MQVRDRIWNLRRAPAEGSTPFKLYQINHRVNANPAVTVQELQNAIQATRVFSSSCGKSRVLVELRSKCIARASALAERGESYQLSFTTNALQEKHRCWGVTSGKRHHRLRSSLFSPNSEQGSMRDWSRCRGDSSSHSARNCPDCLALRQRLLRLEYHNAKPLLRSYEVRRGRARKDQ